MRKARWIVGKWNTPQPVDRFAAILGGGDMRELLPPMSAIPDEFKQSSFDSKWHKFQSDWFFGGLTNLRVTTKPGIDEGTALAHLAAIQRSFDPSHKHKIAAVAWLASLWLEDVSYEHDVHSEHTKEVDRG